MKKVLQWRKTVMSICIVICAVFFITGDLQAQTTKRTSNNVIDKSGLTYKIIEALNKTYGYDIYVDGKLKIHQTSIPALSGNKGFTTSDAAEKVAKKVMVKMKIGEGFPTITIEEMKQLKVI